MSSPWISADIIKLMYGRDHAHKTATKNNDPALYGRYKRLRNQVTAMINANKKEYYKPVDALSKSVPKEMWGKIKQLVTNKPKHQQRLCNLTPQSFNKFFVQIWSSQVDGRWRMNADDIYWKGPKSMYTFRFKEIIHVDVEQYFVSLSSKANNDLFDFDIRLIKYATPFISKSLSWIINESLLQGRVHMDWKRARVSPVYNGEGDLDFGGNYRPISVIGHIVRLVESLVCSQIIHYLESHDFISHKQRVLMHGHQGWNVRHGFCHIYIRYVYIWVVYSFFCFVMFVHCFNVMVCVQACLVTLWLFIISCYILYKTTLGLLCSWFKIVHIFINTQRIFMFNVSI